MTGRVGRWTGVKKEVVIMLYVLSQTIGCYAANQLPSSDVQQNGMSDNMLNNQRVVVHKDDISEHAEKSQSMVYVKRFQLDVSGIEEAGLSIPDDISVAGYDGIPMSSVVKPRLTTVRQDRKSVV